MRHLVIRFVHLWSFLQHYNLSHHFSERKYHSAMYSISSCKMVVDAVSLLNLVSSVAVTVEVPHTKTTENYSSNFAMLF